MGTANSRVEGRTLIDASTQPVRLGVLVSGRGTNLQAVLDAIAGGRLLAEVALVLCNHAGAPAIERAKVAGVPFEIVERKDFASRRDMEQAVRSHLQAAGTDLVVCAGWDQVLAAETVRRFEGRIINVHPALLPSFSGGMHAIEEALAYGAKVTGCTVHFVTEDVDAGPIISQAAVPVLPGDDVESLRERIQKEEHRLLVDAIKLYAQGRLKTDGRVVRVADEVL